jgi:hypothetical protein
VLDVPGVLEDRAHQRVGGREVGFVHEPDLARDVRLELRDQPDVAPPREELDGAADADQEILGLVDELAFAHADDAGRIQVVAGGGGEPAERRDVAQTPAALLQVGFEEMGAGAEPLTAHSGRVPRATRERRRICPRGGPNGIQGSF